MKIVKFYKPNQILILFLPNINFATFPAEKNNNKNSKSKHAVKYDLIYNLVDIEVIENKREKDW